GPPRTPRSLPRSGDASDAGARPPRGGGGAEGGGPAPPARAAKGSASRGERGRVALADPRGLPRPSRAAEGAPQPRTRPVQRLDGHPLRRKRLHRGRLLGGGGRGGAPRRGRSLGSPRLGDRAGLAARAG